LDGALRVEAFPTYLGLAAIIGLFTGILLAWLTRTRFLTIILSIFGLVFVLSYVGWFSAQLALVSAVVAGIAAAGGSGLAAAMKRYRGS
jgi:hypothetical protein